MKNRERSVDLEGDEEIFLQEFGPKLEALQARHAQCPDVVSILAAQSGALPEDTAAQIAEHVAHCDWCRAIESDWREVEFPEPSRETSHRIRQRVIAAGEAPVRSPTSRVVWRWIVPIGAAAALVVIFMLGREARQTTSQSSLTTSEHRAPVSPPQTAQPPAATSPSVFALMKPPVRLPLAAAVTWRGESDPDRARFAEQFKAAMAHYRADEYGPAAARLAPLARQFPRSPEVTFYLGVCQLFLDRNQAAIVSLERARGGASGDFAREVTWYLAVALQRAGDTNRAVALLSGLCQGRSAYSAQACAGVQELKPSRAETDRK